MSHYDVRPMRVLVDLVRAPRPGLCRTDAALSFVETGKYRSDWRERRGWLPELPAVRMPEQPRVWIHAVSVGETNAVRDLIARLVAAITADAIRHLMHHRHGHRPRPRVVSRAQTDPSLSAGSEPVRARAGWIASSRRSDRAGRTGSVVQFRHDRRPARHPCRDSERSLSERSLRLVLENQALSPPHVRQL